MIEAAGLTKRYGQVQALRGVDFTVARGETFGIIGPNGAGKTTLLKVILGLVRPDAGRVAIDGVELSQEPVRLRRAVGYVPQRDGFDEESTGREALVFLASLRGVQAAEVVARARTVGVEELLDRRVGTLSGGQRQRLSVAAALLGDPPVMLLDEPTASLDPRATAAFRTLVADLAAAGRTIVLCSHLLDDVERLCGRVLVLLDGRVATIEEVDKAGAPPPLAGLEARFLAAVGTEDDDGVDDD
ncbi:MAG: ABC transporter ATP-binding protein [Lentisphaeria bacterium]|jgi:heme ABC exporter ATP-binding subunit CcmA|nr:ABC transporter ATP-binding protein [Lentisphaeria bacterium]